ncbi:MAG TPA: VWA domain-containing protein [Vicinamibacterales bacterium]
MKSLALVVATCSLCVVVSAQPTFRSGVELVTIDVVATDLNGKPVFNLKPSDFELFEDGKSQPIKAFQFIDSSVVPPEVPLPPGVVSNDVEPGGVFALVLDEIGIQVNDAQRVRRVAERFINEALQPNDYVAVVRSGVNSGFFLTSDRTLALNSIQRTTGRREQTLGITAPGPDTPAVVEGPTTIESFGTGENGRDSFRVLFGVVEQLRHIKARRKAILWYSRGGNLPAGYLESIEYGRVVGRDDEVFSKLIDTARAANVAIYTIDPRGTQAPGEDVSRDFEPGDNTTLRDLAGWTGGRALLGNDSNALLARVAAENRSYYLLGYEPASTGDRRRARKIKVTTKAPGVSVLHRAVYLPATAASAAAPQLMASPLPLRDLPIALAPAAVAIDKNKRGVLIPFEIGRDLREGTDVEYTAMAFDAAGKMVARAAGRGKARDGRLVGDIGVPVESNTYQIRFGARALNPDVEGLAFATVAVPAGKSKDPVCGGFVFEQPGARAGLRLFTRQQPITISTLVSAEKLAGAMAFGLGAAGGVPQKTWPVALNQPLANGLWRVALSLNAPLPGGNLEIRLMQNDLLLDETCLTQFVAR